MGQDILIDEKALPSKGAMNLNLNSDSLLVI